MSVIDTNRRPNWLIAVLLVAILGVLVHRSGANRPAPPSPTVVAIVDLEKVYDGLDARRVADAELDKFREEVQKNVDQQRGAIEVKRQDIDIYPPGSPKQTEIRLQIAELTYKLQAYIDFAEAKRNLSRARMLRTIYRDVKKSVADYARQHGYDLVLLDDTVVELPRDATEVEMTRQISARRLLFAGDQIDITAELIEFMN